MADCPSVSLRFSFRKRDPNAEFCVSLCLGLVFIVCMYYVTVIALSHHVSVVMCFVHMIIIIIATSPGVEVRKYWHVDFGHRIWRSTAVIVVKFEGINSKYIKVRDVHSTAKSSNSSENDVSWKSSQTTGKTIHIVTVSVQSAFLCQHFRQIIITIVLESKEL